MPPIRQGGLGDGGYGLPQPVTAVTGFAMTRFFTRGAVQVRAGRCGHRPLRRGYKGCSARSAGGQRRPPLRKRNKRCNGRATARVAPTKALQEARCEEESPGHGFAVPAPFRQGGQGDGGGGCSCCGAQNFHAALRRTLEILTAATRSLRFLCHRQRSVRSPQPVCALASQ